MDNEQLRRENGIISLWRSFESPTSFTSLSGNVETTVAIIGGGITGIATAQLLKEAGFNVVVLEALKVGVANTGHSTGNLYVAVEEGFDKIQSKYDTDTLRTIISARRDAIDLMERNVSQFALDCDFKKVSWYQYSSNDRNVSKVADIQKAGNDAGLSITDVNPGELPFVFKKAIKLENQAQFNPLSYTQQLAKAIADESCVIYENSVVTEIDKQDDFIVVKTDSGSVKAKYLVHATHIPKGLVPEFQAILGTYREYGIAAKLKSDSYPEGTFWGYYNDNDKYSVRSYMHDGEQYIIVVGQPHPVGQKENNQENINNLETFLKEKFDVSEITHRWGGQNYKPADGLPYIGRRSKNSNVFIATGFSTDGLTYGTLSAMIIRDMLVGIETPYTELFDSTRHSPLKAAENFIKENANNAAVVLKDYIFSENKDTDDIAPNQGKVVKVDGHKLAVFRSDSGELKAVSAICTHMGCVVHWNGAEKTWDCPCHASRFDTDGCIIEGPALKPLEKRAVSK